MQIILWLLYRWELYVTFTVLSQFLYVTFVVLSLLLTFTFKDKNAQFEGYVICTGKSETVQKWLNNFFGYVHFFKTTRQKKHLKKTNSLVKVSFFLAILEM